MATVVLGVSLFHWRGLLPGRTFLPVDLANNNLPWTSSYHPLQNWLISDPLYQFYPFLNHAVQAIQHGLRWPLWNPTIFLGHPALADPLSQTFYPLFAGLGLALGAARGLAVGLWLHVVLAALLMYAFLREIGCRRPAAVAGGFTYALSGYLVTWFETTFWVGTLTWLPGVLWAYELAVHRRRWWAVALAGLFMTLAILGGQFAFALVFFLFLGVYALGRTVELARQGRRTDAWPLMAWAAIVALGALSSAVQTIPFAEFLPFTRRTIAQGLADPLPVQQLITLVVPNFYGNPATVGGYWGELNYSEGTIYAGLVALLLAALAPFVARRFFVFYLALVTAATVYLVVGGPGVQMLGSVPFLKYVSLHRTSYLLPLLIAMLAAITMSQPKLSVGAAVAIATVLVLAVGVALALQWSNTQEYWLELRWPLLLAIVLLVCAVVLIALGVSFPERRTIADCGLVGLMFVDLFLFGSRYNPTGPVAELMPLTPAIEYLQAHSGIHRVLALQGNDVIFGPNVLSIYGVADAGGYSSLVSARYHQLVTAGDPKLDIWWMDRNGNMVTFSHPAQRLLDLLQVAHVVSPLPLADPGIRAEWVADGCESDSGEIAGGDPITGTVAVRDTAINRMDVRFRVYRPGETQEALAVRLWQKGERPRLVMDTQLDIAQLRDEESVTLYFAPERDAPGHVYTWEIASADGTAQTGVGLCMLADGSPSVSVYGADWSQVFEGKVYIYERSAPYPRATVVYAAEFIPDDVGAVRRLLDDSFDLRNVAVVADPVDLPAEADSPAGRAEITHYADDLVRIKASAARPGLLVLGDQYHPGWQAYVDGRPATIVRANHIFRGVILPPGDHEVLFRFAPTSLRIGGLLSLLGIALMIVLAATALRPRRLARLRTASEPVTYHNSTPPTNS